MAKPISVIGVDPAELPFLRTLVRLLRHPDPVVSELTRQALDYLDRGAASELPGIPPCNLAPPSRNRR